MVEFEKDGDPNFSAYYSSTFQLVVFLPVVFQELIWTLFKEFLLYIF